MAKKIQAMVKLQIAAGKATPAPPETVEELPEGADATTPEKSSGTSRASGHRGVPVPDRELYQ